MASFGIRPLQTMDRLSVFQIAADTAFFGKPLEYFFEDRSLYCDAFCAYYVDFESQHAWVAEKDQQVVGYLFGCVDTQGMNATITRSILPRLISKLCRGEYHLGKKSALYLWRLGKALLKKEIPTADLSRFPAHLHVNVAASQRGRGIGEALLDCYLHQLRREQVVGVHLKTTSENKAACYLYEKIGFVLVEARRTDLWQPWLGREIESRCYAMSL